MAEKLERLSGGLPKNAQRENIFYKTSDPRPHYMELDGLRGIAIIMAVLTHVAAIWQMMIQASLYLPLLGVDLLDLILFGYLAVPLFFLLSGYLLTWTEEGRKRRENYSVLNYAKRRILRIVPAYYLAIVVVLLTWPTHISFWPVALHLTFLQGFKPSYPPGLDGAWWSLTPEIIFYAMLPLLVLKFRTFAQRTVILMMLVLVSLGTRLLQVCDIFGIPSSLDHTLGINRLYHFPTTTLYLFLVGMLLRMIVERRTNTGHKRRYWQPYVAAVLTVVPIVVISVFPYLIIKQSDILHHPLANLAEVMAILVFVSILLGSPILKPVLRFRPLVFFGEISYSLFLLHDSIMVVVGFPVKDVIRHWLSGQSELMIWATFSVFAFTVLAVSGIIAYLSYRYIESPFMRYKPK